MKKIVVLLMSLGMCLSFVGCSSVEGDSDGGLSPDSSQQPATCSITFQQNGYEDIVKTVNKGETLTDIPTPKGKVGYTVSWSVSDFTNITDDVLVVAVETVKSYTITLNADGGTVEVETITICYGEEYTLECPTHINCGFEYWTFNGQAVKITGVWSIDVEGTAIELIACWETWTPDI